MQYSSLCGRLECNVFIQGPKNSDPILLTEKISLNESQWSLDNSAFLNKEIRCEVQL